MATTHSMNVTTEILDIEEARRRLPEVRRYVQILSDLTREIRAQHGQLEGMTDEVEFTQVELLRERLDDLQEDWRATLKVLNDLGAYVKDPERGLIDFYTWVDGEIAFLCWQLGEPDIHFWHGLEEGYGGRRPID